jgi:hypothetical protein
VDEQTRVARLLKDLSGERSETSVSDKFKNQREDSEESGDRLAIDVYEHSNHWREGRAKRVERSATGVNEQSSDSRAERWAIGEISEILVCQKLSSVR